MILAGIDEAGYGPILGPLVVGCCVFDVEMPAGCEELPCLWTRLRRLTSKTRSRDGRKIHINDSKLVYSHSAGLKELERSVLALAAASGDWPADLTALLSRLAGSVVPQLADYPWYQPPPDGRFPLEQEATSIRLFANALREEMQRTQTRCVHLAAQVILERQLNRQLEQTRNKSSVLFSAAALHLDYLLRTFGQQGLVIFCDRQGGRERYGHLLRLMFEEWALEVVREADGCSEYRLLRDGHAVQLIFREKAETQCMSVAVASMICKYLRESLMRRFNAYWQALLPNLTPTAGYYTDGMRFLQDIAAKRQELGVRDAELIRAK